MFWNLLNDVRYSLRGFALRPSFAVVSSSTLAVAIGANVAVFSLYDQLICCASYPCSRPGELVNFAAPGPKAGFVICGGQGSCDETFSYPLFRDLEKADGPFAGMGRRGHLQQLFEHEPDLRRRGTALGPTRARLRAVLRDARRRPRARARHRSSGHCGYG